MPVVLTLHPGLCGHSSLCIHHACQGWGDGLGVRVLKAQGDGCPTCSKCWGRFKPWPGTFKSSYKEQFAFIGGLLYLFPRILSLVVVKKISLLELVHVTKNLIFHDLFSMKWMILQFCELIYVYVYKCIYICILSLIFFLLKLKGASKSHYNSSSTWICLFFTPRPVIYVCEVPSSYGCTSGITDVQ